MGTLTLPNAKAYEDWTPCNNANIKIDNDTKLENTPCLLLSRKEQKKYSIEKETSLLSSGAPYIFSFYFMPDADFVNAYGKIYTSIKYGNNTARASWKGQLTANKWHFINLRFNTKVVGKAKIKIIFKGPGAIHLAKSKLSQITPPKEGINLSKQYLKIPFGTRFGKDIVDHLDVKKGTIEFWLRPHWEEMDNRHFKNKTIHKFFFWGDAQYDNSISIYAWNKFPNIYFALCGKNHKQGTSVFYYNNPDRGWRKNMWHHIAACWEQEEENTRMTLFIDGMPCGEKIAKTIIRHYLKRDIFIGAGKKQKSIMFDKMADSDFAMLRISNSVKYTKPFTPKEYEADSSTLCFFPLRGENDLTGFAYVAEGKTEKFKATKNNIHKDGKVNKWQ